ncbi:MAG: NAD-dependent epimerase/dehydratase family protein [Patescibacteria group bacterium]
MSKILVTGGAGFIGSTLVDALVAAEEEVVVIDDLSSGKKEYLNPAARFYKVSICSPRLARIFRREKFDIVYHLAAQMDVRKSMDNPRFDNEINLRGGFNVLENCRLNKVKKIIFSSTGGAVYGDAEEIPTPETAPVYPLSFYGIHKLAFEKYLNCYFQVYGLNYTILRFANVYGPRQFKGGEAGVVSIFVDDAVHGLTSTQFGDGEQTRDFVYVGDVVRALVAAKEIDCRGEINIASGREISVLGIRKEIGDVLGAPLKIKEAPAKLGEQRRSCLSVRRAKEVLDWEPEMDFKEGIRRTLEWSRAQVKK